MNTITIIKASLLSLMMCLVSLCQAQLYLPTPLAEKSVTQDFIQQNLRYPEEALKEGRNGKIVVAFHVDEKGNGSQYLIEESFCEEANANALDMVRKIRWSPATRDMKPIGCDMKYTVDYSARTYKRYWKKHTLSCPPLILSADTSYVIYEMHQLEEAAKPYFADGTTMGQFILSNLQYPESAKVGEIAGTVRLNFVVEPDGNISNILVDQSVGGGCDQEAIRLLQMTQWIPAVKNGLYVRSHNYQDITFHIGARNYQDGNAY